MIIFLTISGLYIAEIVLYKTSIDAMNEIDIEMIKFVVENQCTDGPLGRALQFFLDDFAYDTNMRLTGFSFTIISFIAEIVLFVYASPLRGLLGEKVPFLKSFKEPPVFEDRLSTMRGKLGEGLKKRFTLKKLQMIG